MYRGGDTQEVKYIIITPKAQEQLARLRSDITPEELASPMIGRSVTLMADNSAFWIAESYGLRLVFCVQRGRAQNSGRFALVTVQDIKGKSMKMRRPQC